MESTHPTHLTPWLAARYFNEILFHCEKRGGCVRPNEKQLDDFRITLMDCYLHDLGYSGAHFTWSNRREGEGLIIERLDRCVGNSEWCQLFLRAAVCHGLVVYLDNLHLILKVE